MTVSGEQQQKQRNITATSSSSCNWLLERCYRGGNSGPHTVWTDVDDNDDPGESADGVASTYNGVCAWNRCNSPEERGYVCLLLFDDHYS